MPPKRSTKKAELQAEALSASKKLKTTADPVDKELDRSPYSEVELWDKLGYYVRKEVFSLLDIRVSNRLCRVSKSWKGQLIETNGGNSNNKGIAFLDWRVEKKAYTKMNKRFGQATLWPWRSYFQLDFSGITNLVSIGNKITPSHYKKTGKVFSVKNQPLKRVTFWGGRFTHREVVRAAFPLQAKDIAMQLMKCELRWDPEGHFWMTEYHMGEEVKLNLKSFFWGVPVSVQQLVFDETFKVAESSEAAQLSWLFERYDQMNLIWPYGEDQVEWLKSSIDVLEQAGGGVWGSIQYYSLPFHGWKWQLIESFRSVKVPNKAYCLRREELTTLDCAFLARIISTIPENKRPQGWTPPPHPIPKDFGGAWRFD